MQPTPAQRKHVEKTFNELADSMELILRAFKNPKKLKDMPFAEYERLIKRQQDNFHRSQELAAYINKIDSDEPLFNLFQGDLVMAAHTLSPAVFNGILAGICNFESRYYEDDGQRTEPQPAIDWDKKEERKPRISEKGLLELPGPKGQHEDLISLLRFSINCFKVFAKIVSEDFRPKRFMLKNVLDEVIAERGVFGHHRDFKFTADVKNVMVEFDPDALYWIVMRMLSNAEHATNEVKDAWIRVRTYLHKDGNLYLITENNGMTIKERAERSKYRQGGRSMPNIKKITSLLGSEYRLKGFPDHTRACIRLPIAKK